MHVICHTNLIHHNIYLHIIVLKGLCKMSLHSMIDNVNKYITRLHKAKTHWLKRLRGKNGGKALFGPITICHHTDKEQFLDNTRLLSGSQLCEAAFKVMYVIHVFLFTCRCQGNRARARPLAMCWSPHAALTLSNIKDIFRVKDWKVLGQRTCSFCQRPQTITGIFCCNSKAWLRENGVDHSMLRSFFSSHSSIQSVAAWALT